MVCGHLTWHPRAALRNPRTLGEVGAAPVIIIRSLPPRLACERGTDYEDRGVFIICTIQEFSAVYVGFWKGHESLLSSLWATRSNANTRFLPKFLTVFALSHESSPWFWRGWDLVGKMWCHIVLSANQDFTTFEWESDDGRTVGWLLSMKSKQTTHTHVWWTRSVPTSLYFFPVFFPPLCVQFLFVLVSCAHPVMLPNMPSCVLSCLTCYVLLH